MSFEIFKGSGSSLVSREIKKSFIHPFFNNAVNKFVVVLVVVAG